MIFKECENVKDICVIRKIKSFKKFEQIKTDIKYFSR